MEEKIEEKKTKGGNTERVLFLVLILLMFLTFGYWKVGDLTELRKLKKQNIEFAKSEIILSEEIKNRNQKILELTNVSYDELFEKVVRKLQPRIDPAVGKIITKSMLQECKKLNLDPELILAVAYVESTLNPMAESNMGAVGVMQVKYSVWKEQPELKDNGVKAKYHLFWIEQNIQSGTRIFRKYYDEAKGSLSKTLWRYNSGKDLIGDPLNIEYINKVTYTLALIREIMFNNQDLDTELLLEPLMPKKELLKKEPLAPPKPEKKVTQ